MNLKKIILLILLFVWMFVIFSFSSQNGDKSLGLSDDLTNEVLDIKSVVTGEYFGPKERIQKVLDYRFFIRKLAHFSEYFILGVLVFLNLKNYNIKHIIILSLLFCFLYAGSDELHQYFKTERDARLMDVFIDTLGGFFGIFITYLIAKKRKNVIIR